MQGAELLQTIIEDQEKAELYLIRGTRDNSRFARAVAIAESCMNDQQKTLIAARREIEKKNTATSGIG
jgi:dTDP-4-dehydrorhamnose reductase